jgi:hypothetical protein
MIDALPLLLGPEGYQISRSVRLRSSASAYFNRTPGSAGNRKTWTWSGWVKRGALGASQYLFSAGTGGTDVTQNGLNFQADDTLRWTGQSTTYRQTTQVFRDPSAWYHIVLQFDTTQATANDRIRLYVNGTQITAFGTLTNPTQNLDYAVNQAAAHNIGRWTGASAYFDGYLTEVNFIDGQALTPSSFGETNPVTGVWQPKKYTGTYGTNGFYLNFSDNSAATAAAIGKDYSGNSNNWTPNNISVTSGSTYDSMLDVPTQWADGGNGRGNYAVMNPLTYGGTIDNGNLELVTLVSYGSARVGTSSIGATGGKFYWEVTKITGSATQLGIGVVNEANATGGSTRFLYDSAGDYAQNGSVVSSSPATYATNDVIGVAIDATTNTIECFKNGVSQGSYTLSFDGPYFATANDGDPSNQARFAFNFGQRPFAYTPPTGFKALNTLNLPTPTILKGNQYFDVALQTGNTTGRTVSGLAFQPDLVWVKNRAGSTNRRWGVIDSVRGVNKTLSTALTDAEVTSQTDLLTAFNSDGFTIGADAGFYGWNGFAESYAHFIWKEGATQGFDIVTYTGDGLANRTVAHSLGVTPAMVIVKTRSSVANWRVWHQSLSGNTSYLGLNQTAAVAISSTVFNGFSSTTFTVGTDPATNGSGVTLVAYCFAEVAGFSKFGSYTGNGSTDGPFVYLGFKPRFVLIKRSDAGTEHWNMFDSARDTYNPEARLLYANLSNAEASASAIDFLSNGFKPKDNGSGYNTSGATYIYAAFAENPFKHSLAR